MIIVYGAAQIPRLYDIYKAQGLVDNFEQLLDNIFTPLFEVTVDPNSHPQLHLFLKQVGSSALLFVGISAYRTLTMCSKEHL